MRTAPAAERLEGRTLLTNYVVGTDADVVAVDGLVSLREAIQAANTNAAVNEAAAGSGGAAVDAISFNAALAGRTITLAGTELAITGHTNITGLGANRLTISGNNASRVFNVGAGIQLLITDLTVTGGNATGGGSGGGFSVAGTLLLFDCAVTGNAATNNGGGIASVSGSLVDIVDSTISGNTASVNGGGIQNSGTLRVSNSTISGNSANGSAGGVIAAGATTLRNVTLFGNRADADGNASGTGGGIFVGGSITATLHNTLVAGNLRGSGAGTVDDVLGILSPTSSHNLIANGAAAGGLTNGTNGNIIGASLVGLLDPVLRDNGGTTKTHALLPNSEAIDAGDNAQALSPSGSPMSFDQRGIAFRRILQARVDIGAFEAAPAADIVGYIGGQWWAGSSTGTNFTTALWASVPNAAYDALGEADFTGDGKVDAFALLDGAWTVGTSTGTTFTFAAWGNWANANWQDVKAGDLNGDGKADILARLGGQWWGALSNATGTAFLAPTLFTTWADLPWREFFLADVTNDGRADLVGYQRGQWWVGASNGTAFVAPKLVVTWADLPWQKLLLSDPNGDNKADLVGFLSGEWWVSRSTGSATTASAAAPVLAVKWANVPFVDLNAGDFNGDGKDDVTGRNLGNWFVSLSTSAISAAAFAAPTLFAQWSNLAWKDVRVADFDGDGRDDITGRFNGQWWVAESTGGNTTAVTTLWTTWAELAWKAIGAVDATGTPGDGTSSGGGGAFAAGGSSSGPGALLASAARLDDDPLAVFWAKADEDEEFAGLLATA